MARGKSGGMPLFAGFDHVDLRVRDLTEARRLYDVLLPELGLAETRVEDGAVEYYEAPHRDAARRFFGIREDRDHVATAVRIAFSAVSAADVDRLAKVAGRAGARAIEGPEIPWSSEKYYAVFFDDPSGNRLEICYRRPHDDASAKPNVLPIDEMLDVRAILEERTDSAVDG